MNKLATILAYHNGVPLVIGLLFFGSGVAFAASPDMREAVVGVETFETIGIDNAAIIDANLDSFDVDLRIDEVSEDDEHYLVAYSYRTITLVEHVWEETRKTDTLIVTKTAVDGDIKTYAITQLREVARNELAYLVRVQEAERAAGRQEASVVKKYTGLTGLAVGLTDALLPPKVPPVVEEEEMPYLETASVPSREEDTKVEVSTTTPDTEPNGEGETIPAEPVIEPEVPEEQASSTEASAPGPESEPEPGAPVE